MQQAAHLAAMRQPQVLLNVLRIQTQHHDYTAVTLAENSVLISGHPEYCPEPVLVAITDMVLRPSGKLDAQLQNLDRSHQNRQNSKTVPVRMTTPKPPKPR